MLVFIFMIFIFALMFLVLYFPVIFQHIALKRAKSNFTQELQLLSDFYEDKLLIVTDRLGEGTSQNSDVKFAQAHENQVFAINSVLDLIGELEE